ncbi:hypothetical protein Tco_0058661 [Tanacetum coccineum]
MCTLMAPSSYLKPTGQTSRGTVIDLSTTLEGTYHTWLSRISKPSPRTNEFGEWVKLSDPKQALLGWQPMLIRLSWIFEASRARGFVLRSQELQILSFIWEIQYPNLID